MSESKRAIVNVSTGPAFLRCQDRLIQALDKVGSTEKRFFWRDEFPPGAPPHAKVPYGFKLTALKAAMDAGYTTLLWLDSSIWPLHSLEPIWVLLEEQGYWFIRNYDLMTDQFCSDYARKLYGKSWEELSCIPQVVGGAFGLNTRKSIGRIIFVDLLEWRHRGAFANGLSTYPFHVAHRHDQTSMSIVVNQLGLNMSLPPCAFAERGRETIETILV